MGLYDRDYIRSRPPRFGAIQALSVNTWLIIINLAVFFFGEMFAVDRWAPFSVASGIFGLQVWRFITFQFVHANVQHILYNMIGLYFFGPIVESTLGSRRYLGFYLISGIGGAVMFVVLWATHVLVGSPYDDLIGASAGIFGVLVACAVIAPNLRVYIDFFIPMSMRTMALLYLALALYTVLRAGNNAGGQAAHLGGAVVGFFLIKNPQLLNFLSPSRRIGAAPGAPRRRTAFRDWSNDLDH